jgi:hypothetical protein
MSTFDLRTALRKQRFEPFQVLRLNENLRAGPLTNRGDFLNHSASQQQGIRFRAIAKRMNAVEAILDCVRISRCHSSHSVRHCASLRVEDFFFDVHPVTNRSLCVFEYVPSVFRVDQISYCR